MKHIEMLPRNSGKSFPPSMYGGNVGEVPLTREQRRKMKREKEKHINRQKKIARKLGFVK
jgi:hypothetical protein